MPVVASVVVVVVVPRVYVRIRMELYQLKFFVERQKNIAVIVKVQAFKRKKNYQQLCELY